MRIQLLDLSLAALLALSTTAAAQTMDPTAAGHAGMQMASGPGITALLTGEMGTRSPTGTVSVAGTAVRVAWSGDQPGSTRPWYVHKGSCGRDEGVVGTGGSYRPIAVDARGTGTGTATLPAPLAAPGPYYVAVHAAAADTAAGVIACGPLRGGGLSEARAASPAAMAGMGNMAEMGNMAGMDHSMMDMNSMSPAATGAGTPTGRSQATAAAQRSGADSGSSLLMAVHMRMMADPVIRERAMTDPTLQRMMAQMRMPAETSVMPMPMRGSTPPAADRGGRRAPRPAARVPRRRAADPHAGHEGMAMPGMNTTPAKPAAPAASAPARGSMPGMDHSKMPGMTMPQAPAGTPSTSTKRPAPKPAPTARAASKPAAPAAKKDSMPGMDHSKMPGMGKP